LLTSFKPITHGYLHTSKEKYSCIEGFGVISRPKSTLNSHLSILFSSFAITSYSSSCLDMKKWRKGACWRMQSISTKLLQMEWKCTTRVCWTTSLPTCQKSVIWSTFWTGSTTRSENFTSKTKESTWFWCEPCRWSLNSAARMTFLSTKWWYTLRTSRFPRTIPSLRTSRLWSASTRRVTASRRWSSTCHCSKSSTIAKMWSQRSSTRKSGRKECYNWLIITA